LLVEHEILTTSIGTSGRDEYLLTPKGEQLWPVVWAMMHWGNEYYVIDGLRRPIVHHGCGGQLTPLGNCGRCGRVPAPRDLEVHPRASRSEGSNRDDRISKLLMRPHRMLEPFTDAA
jgi:HxlR-like helix-turn-helix protein